MPPHLKSVERVLAEVDAIGDLLVILRTRLSAIYLLLDGAMFEAHPPLCPRCGGPMIIRTQHNNPHSRFLGCAAYTKTHCKGSLNLDTWRQQAEEAVRAKAPPPE